MLGDIKQLAMKKIHLISGLALLSLLGIGATWVISKATESSQILPEVIKNVPEFSMISHEGESFTRDSLLNKITVLDFISAE